MKPPIRPGRSGSSAYEPSAPRPRRRRSILPAALITAVILFIASREIPWLADRINALLQPQQQAAIELCRQRALDTADNPEFARIIKGGQCRKTLDGFLVNRLVIGELSSREGERRVNITCHIDSNGTLANFVREAINPDATANEPPQRPAGPPFK